MKKSLFIILVVFILPILLYIGLEKKSEASYGLATTDGTNAIVYKFTSPLCAECQVVQKIIDKIEGNYDYVIFEEVNVGGKNADKKEVRDLIERYNITVVPTLVFIDNKGRFHKKIEVDMTEKDITNVLEKIAVKKDK